MAASSQQQQRSSLEMSPLVDQTPFGLCTDSNLGCMRPCSRVPYWARLSRTTCNRDSRAIADRQQGHASISRDAVGLGTRIHTHRERTELAPATMDEGVNSRPHSPLPPAPPSTPAPPNTPKTYPFFLGPGLSPISGCNPQPWPPVLIGLLQCIPF